MNNNKLGERSRGGKLPKRGVKLAKPLIIVARKPISVIYAINTGNGPYDPVRVSAAKPIA